MPGKLSQIRRFAEAAERARVAGAPRDGYFSVLDEMVQDLPQDKEFSRREVLQRLKAGNMLKRDDMQWPLKQSEIDYALMPALELMDDLDQIEVPDLLQRIRNRRPRFYSQLDMTKPNTSSPFQSYDIHGPDKKPGSYFESLTDSASFDGYPTHFGEANQSFSRGSVHNVGTPEQPEWMRLIAEIQNDRANAARRASGWDNTERGWRPRDHFVQRAVLDSELAPINDRIAELNQQIHDLDPTDEFAMTGSHPKEAEIERIYKELIRLRGQSAEISNRLTAIRDGVPDAPFKDPADYGRLEIKNAVLDAIANKEQGVGISPKSPVSHDSTGHTYQKVYPGELSKIAKQYGAEMTTRPVRVASERDYPMVDLIEYGNPANAMFDTVDQVFDPAYYSLGDYHEIYPTVNRWSEMEGNISSLSGNLISQMTGIDRRDLAQDILRANGGYHQEITNQMPARSNWDQLTESEKADFDDLMQERVDAVRAAVQRASDALDARSGSSMQVPYARFTEGMLERIKKYGLPLFSVAGSGVLLQPEGDR